MTKGQAWVDRVVWGWCVGYTALAFGESGRRRREEIRSHLWESWQAGLHPRRVLRAAVGGSPADVAWAGQATLRGLVPVLRSPAPYLVAAACVTVQAAFAWNGATARVAHLAQAWSTVAAIALLGVAGIAALARRRP